MIVSFPRTTVADHLLNCVYEHKAISVLCLSLLFLFNIYNMTHVEI